MKELSRKLHSHFKEIKGIFKTGKGNFDIHCGNTGEIPLKYEFTVYYLDCRNDGIKKSITFNLVSFIDIMGNAESTHVSWYSIDLKITSTSRFSGNVHDFVGENFRAIDEN